MTSLISPLILCTAVLHGFQVASLLITDNSLLWSTGSKTIFYNTKASNWTNAQISSTEFSQTFTPIQMSDRERTYGMAADARQNHLLIVDKSSRTIVLSDLSSLQSTFFHMGTSPDIGQLAIDWRGRNVYWADTGFGWIVMKKLPKAINTHDSTDHRFKVVVDKYLQRPTGIAVHPHKFYLFWADKGGSPQIERSDLTGHHRTIIIWQGMIEPTTLCIDITTDRLYWSDPGRGTVEYSDFNGDGRTILMSEPQFNYYGIAIFQTSLIYTVPRLNYTGFVSLRDNIEGDHLQAILAIKGLSFQHVLAYDTDLQPREEYEGCDSSHPAVACQQICLHMPNDQGRTCLCNDGYDLILNQNCSADQRVIQRHILFTYQNEICAMPISVLGFEQDSLNQVTCDVITSETAVERFSLDMTNKLVYFTDGSSIYRQKPFTSDKTMLYNTTEGRVIDMDYDWKTHILYWIQTDDQHLYNIDVDTQSADVDDIDLGIGKAISIAVDPHHGQIFWISKLADDSYSLYKWKIEVNKKEIVPTTLLAMPTDLEYDRMRNRLLWNDNTGYIGVINVDSTGETRYNIKQHTGQKRWAVSMYKNYIISTSEENQKFGVIYELDQNQFQFGVESKNITSILDVHVYETSLQPADLEPCERQDNGGCEHICVPHPTQLICKCLLGYILAPDNKSCITEVLTRNFYVAMDMKHRKLYQIDRTTNIPHTIQIDNNNHPTSIAFDSSRNVVVWVDNNQRVVKKKVIGKSGEIAMKTGVDSSAEVAVDVSTGNIYVASDRNIVVINRDKDSTTVVDSTSILGTVGKITLQPTAGRMAWFEYGSRKRIIMANMDGTKVEVLLDQRVMETTEDLAFDLDDDNWLYWCDSSRDTVSRIDLVSFANTDIYMGRELNPVAIDIVDSYIYLVPKHQRKIVRLDKVSGQNQEIVFESPLFGTFTNFFIYRDNVRVHALCSNCNGGCSNICLPSGTTRKCACSDGAGFKDDGTICKNAGLCFEEDSYSKVDGIKTISECCPTGVLHQYACTPQCAPDFQLASGSLTCIGGRWNVSLDELCQDKTQSLPILYIAVGAGGGCLLVIIVIVAICVCRKKQGKDQTDARRLNESMYTDSTYASTDAGLSPDPPPRPVQVQEEVYHHLDESQMVDASKLTVDLPPHPTREKTTKDGRYWDPSDRYSMFPEYRDGGYLTPSEIESRGNELQRNHEGNREAGDGYLSAQSISGGSMQEISGGSFDAITIRYDPNRNVSDERVQPTVRYLPHNESNNRNPPTAHTGGYHDRRTGDYRSGYGHESGRSRPEHLSGIRGSYTENV